MKKYLLIILAIIYIFFIGIFDVNAQVLPIQSDYGVVYGNSAQLINSPNSNTTWNWGYNFNNASGRVDALEIYFHSNGEDITSFNQYLTFMVGGYNQTFPLSNNEMSPFSIGGAVLKVQGATYMCSVDSNNSNTSYNNNSFNTWSATINCDTSSGINIGKSSNFASLWIQINSINGYSQFFAYISKDMYASDSKLFTNNTAFNDIKTNTQNINDSINDSNIDTNSSNSATSGFSSSTNSGMSNTPVSGLITLPITFLTGVSNAISSSCTNINYIELFNYQLVLPCLNLSQRLGNVWTIIDTIFSCMLIFSIGKSLVRTFARLSDMDTNIMYECYANGKSHRGDGD